MVFLASLRDPTSGSYHEDSLTALLGPEDADRTIRHSHYQVFSQWLGFNLAEQMSDIVEFLRGKRAGHGRAENWHSLLPYRQLMPAWAREVERQLYLADLETLLELLRAEQRGAFAVPKA